MAESGVYKVASEEIIFESFDGDVVVLDIGNGRYYGFSGIGSCAWEALSSKVPASALIGLGSGDGKITAPDLEAFLGRLLEFGLIVPSPGEAGQTISDELAVRFAAAEGRVDVQRHDELSDLLLVDPIHDVEEAAGWPVIRQPTA